MNNIKINLLPWREELRFLREEKLKRLFIYSGVLGLVIAAAIIFGMKLIVEEQRNRVARINTELSKYVKADKLLTEQKKAVEDLTNRIKVLGNLNDQRVKVVDLMERFSKALDEDSFIYTLSFEVDKLSFHGLARDQESVIRYLKLLEKNKVGLTPIPNSKDVYVDQEKIIDFIIELKPSI